jgi:hypothetical protein
MASATRALWHWWRDASAEGVPQRHRFDIAEHSQLVPNLYLIEPVPGGYRLRLAGARFEQMFNRRRRHEWRHDAAEPLTRAFAGYFDFVPETGRTVPLRIAALPAAPRRRRRSALRHPSHDGRGIGRKTRRPRRDWWTRSESN